MNIWFKRVGFAVELGLVIWGLSACMKAPDFKQEFGEEVASQTIDEAIREIESASPFTIKQGEFSYAEKTSMVENTQPIIVTQRGDTVTVKREEATSYFFTVMSELAELIDNQMKFSCQENDLRLQKQTSVSALELDFKFDFKPFAPRPCAQPTTQVSTSSLLRGNSYPEGGPPLKLRELQAKDATEENRVTYHKLRKEAGTVPVPSLVKKRANCGGLSAAVCAGGIPVTRLSFDRVDWEGDTGTKTSYLFIFSKIVPYFSYQLLGCAETTLPFQGQRVHVTQCEQVKDFTYGHD